MSIAPAADIVRLWADAGTPVRLVCAGRRYRVLTAEPLRAAAHHDQLTHPVQHLTEWVLVASAEADPTELRTLQLQRTAGSDDWLLVDVDPA
jgi:hypothetical protein